MGIGTYHRCFFLGKHLSRLGHEITLVCASGKIFDLNVSARKIDGVKVITVPRLKIQMEQLFQAVFEIAQSLSTKCDIIHGFAVSQPASGIPTIFSKVLRRKLTIVDWDDYWKKEGLVRFEKMPVTRRVIGIFEERIPQLADGVTVVSDFLLERAKEIGIRAEKIYKIPNGANIDKIRPVDKKYARKRLNLDPNCPLMLCFGISFLERTLEVFLRVKKEMPDTRLLALGKNVTLESVRKTCGDLADKIIIAGYQPMHKIPYYLGAADVLVLTMEDTLSERARWPIRLGDYLASGRPIISNAVGEVKKILEENRCGLTCPPHDIETFSEIAIGLLSNEKLRDKLGKRARKVAEEKYSWNKIAVELDKLYSELTKEKTGAQD